MRKQSFGQKLSQQVVKDNSLAQVKKPTNLNASLTHAAKSQTSTRCTSKVSHNKENSSYLD
jgi:hypothetical protein